MTTTYTPRADSLAAKLIAHLTSDPIPLTQIQVAKMFGVPRNSPNSSLKPALAAGVLVKVGEGRSAAFALPGDVPAQAKPATQKKRTATKRRAPYARAVAEVAAPAPAPVAALWDDGEIVLYGLQQNADGSVCLTAEQAVAVHRFLAKIIDSLHDMAAVE